MSNVAFDQLLQITGPNLAPRESSRQGAGNGELFRSHLDRAANVAEPKPAHSNDDAQTTRIEEDESSELEPKSREDSLAEDEQSPQVTETKEAANTGEENEAPQDDDTTDEVTLSSAAAAQNSNEESTAAVAIQPVPTSEITVSSETGQEQSQQGSSQQTPAIGTEESTATNSAAIAAFAENEAALVGEHPDGEQSNKIATATGEQPIKSNGNATSSESSNSPAVTEIAGQVATQVQAKAKDVKSTAVGATREVTPDDAESSSAGTTKQEIQSSNQSSTATPEFKPSLNPTSQLDLDTLPSATNLSSESQNSTTTAATSQPANADVNLLAGKTLDAMTSNNTEQSSTSTQRTSNDNPPSVDRARFVQRVSGAIRSAQQRDGQIQLRLSPPELGTLRIQLTVSEGAITAHLEAETATARNALLENLPALRERLAEQEITIEKFDVDVGREGHQNNDNQEAQHRDPKARSTRTQTSGENVRSANEVVETSTRSVSTHETDTGLDVRI